jgi:hypothetical protein
MANKKMSFKEFKFKNDKEILEAEQAVLVRPKKPMAKPKLFKNLVLGNDLEYAEIHFLC